jgi:hypothetical protein
MGTAWTADYLKVTGEPDVNLHSNIAAEARAKIVYDRLIDFCDDAGTKEALQSASDEKRPLTAGKCSLIVFIDIVRRRWGE